MYQGENYIGQTASDVNQNPTILTAIKYFFAPGETFELCVLGPRVRKSRLWDDEYISSGAGKKGLAAGWFDSPEKAAQLAAQADSQASPEGIYLTLNPVNPALLGRANNRLKASPQRTNDTEISCLRHLLIDADPARPAGVSSSDAEKAAAVSLLDLIRTHLANLGWPEPLFAESGNGGHLIYRLPDLANTQEHIDLIKACLQALAAQYDTPQIAIDQKVFNPARISKLYGTHARKGDSTPDRPHRLAQSISAPSEPIPVPMDLLQSLAALAPKPEIKPSPRQSNSNFSGDSRPLDVPAYLAKYGRTLLKTKQHGTSTLFILDECVFNPDHKGGEAAIGQTADGKLFYQCYHNSCNGRTWHEARQLISGDEPLFERRKEKSNKVVALRKEQGISTQQKIHQQKSVNDTIQIEKGAFGTVVDASEAILSRDDLPTQYRTFQRGEKLVRVASLPAPKSIDKIYRPEGSITIIEVQKAFISDILSRFGKFEKYDKRSEAWLPADPPKEIAETIVTRAGIWPVPVLRGVISCPTIRQDGSLLLESGYDYESGYYLSHNLDIQIPAEPTQDHAIESLHFLADLLSGFLFVEHVDYTVALALIITAVVRPAIPTSPIFTITAPVRGSGKSTLMDIASIIATGKKSAVVSATSDQDELDKRIVGCLLAGDAIINLDNINGVLQSDILCQATTSDAVKIRPLGKSPQQTIPNTALWSANGNNLTLSGDLSRRALMCRIDPGMEHPEERKFKFDPTARASEYRSRYVSAILTIIQAYQVAGQPDMGLIPFGSFEGWSQLVRSALVWAGTCDPCESRNSVIEDDPDAATLRSLMGAWWDRFGRTPRSVRELVKAGDEEDSPLGEVLHDIAGDGRAINTKRLGWWLRGHAGRIIDDRKIVRMNGERTATWKILPADEMPAA